MCLLYILEYVVIFCHCRSLGTCDEECQKRYLIQYGYIDIGNDSRSEDTVSLLTVSNTQDVNTLDERVDTVQQISKGIINLQKDAGILETGIINSETLNLMQTPRCGIKWSSHSHRQKRFVILKGWNTTKNKINETVVTWYFDTSNLKQINTKLSLDTIKTVFRTSMTKWSKSSLIQFKEVDEEANANITLQFLEGNHGDGYNFDGPGNILAHAFYPNQGKMGGDVHFDLGEEWTLWDEKNIGTSLFNVAIHELGHALGIGHSSQKNSIMYAWYSPENIELSEDDSHAINQLYGVRPQYKFGPIGPNYNPKMTTTSTPQRTTTQRTTTQRTTTQRSTQRYKISDFKKLFIQNSKVFIYPKVATLSI
jgi:Matrixin